MDVATAKIILNPGVYFLIPGNRRRSQVSGKVIAVKKVNFIYSTFYFDHEMTLTHRLDDCDGMRALSEIKVSA